MVFGAMTQACVSPNGWGSIERIRWTGDYIILPDSFVGDIDINQNGSNIHFLSAFEPNNSLRANICTIPLGKNYVLSSNTAPPIRVPANIGGYVWGFGFDPTGTSIFWGNPLVNNINNVYTSNPFIVPNPFPTTVTTFKSSIISGMMSVTNKTWFSTYYQGYPPKVNDKIYTYIDRFGSRPFAFSNLLTTNKYNVGGHHGISAEKDNKVVLELSGISTANNRMILNRFTSNLGGNVVDLVKLQWVNIYPLFPANMKPTAGYGIVVDREQGQWLFVNALINSKYTICKFHLRAT